MSYPMDTMRNLIFGGNAVDGKAEQKELFLQGSDTQGNVSQGGISNSPHRRKMYMCLKCKVPLKGHECPYRRKSSDNMKQNTISPKKRPKGATQDGSANMSPKQKRPKVAKQAQCEGSVADGVPGKGSPTSSQGADRIPGKARMCRKCKVPMKNHHCPHRSRGEKSKPSGEPNELAPRKHDKSNQESSSFEEAAIEKLASTTEESDTGPTKSGDKSPAKTRLCRKCRVPVKGHKCPHRSEKVILYRDEDVARRYDSLGKATFESPKTSEALNELTPKRKPKDQIIASPSQHSGLMLLRGAAMSVLEEAAGEARPGGRQCRKCKVPFKGHKCPFRASNATKKYDGNRLAMLAPKKGDSDESHQEEEESSQLEDGDESNDDERKMKSSSDFKSNDMCAVCDVPSMGHVCPYNKASQSATKNAAPDAGSSEHADSGLDTLSAVAAFAAGDQSASAPNQWTEVMAPAHILQDEVHSYLLQQNLTEAERTYLQTWAGSVHSQMVDQNRLILENIELSDVRKNVAVSVSEERDALVSLRAKIRRIQTENEQLGERISAQRHDNSVNTAASRFLDAIDVLRRNANQRDGG